MAAFNKFTQFVLDLGAAKHAFAVDAVMALLTNTAPSPADTIVDTTTTPCTVKATSNALEVAAGNGYTKKGNTAAFTSWSGDSAKLVLVDPTAWTAGPSAMPTFRYVVLYNDSKGTTATRPVIGWYDYGVGGVTLQVG